MPFKDFTVGQALTSAEVDNFLMRQTVMVFDDATARDTALAGLLTEGMHTFLKDVNSLEFFNGSEFEPVSDPVLSEGEPGQYLESNGQNGSRWENFISPLMLLGV